MPNLTVEEAIDEFPEVCRVLAPDSPSKDYAAGFWTITAQSLTCAALRYLAGKRILTLSIPAGYKYIGKDKKKLYPKAGHPEMPEDPLRWLLEEVREHLKQEKDNA